MLRELAEGIVSDPEPIRLQLCVPIKDDKDFFNPNIVKVVTDQRGRALYFSSRPYPSCGMTLSVPCGSTWEYMHSPKNSF
jgi:3-deoxy-manno-octulosonate cytidylyltransferase (CMP-KDO synthetase)